MKSRRDRWVLAQQAIRELDRHEGPVVVPPDTNIPIKIGRRYERGQAVLNRSDALAWVLNVSASAASPGRIANPSVYQ